MDKEFDYSEVVPQSGMITVPYDEILFFDTLTVTNIDKDQANQVAHSARRYGRTHKKRVTCNHDGSTLTIQREW